MFALDYQFFNGMTGITTNAAVLMLSINIISPEIIFLFELIIFCTKFYDINFFFRAFEYDSFYVI
jgi:hypothetical protein